MTIGRIFDTSRARRFPAAGFCIVGLTGLIVLQGLIFSWRPVDDAYISFRFAQNWADGHGLVFNPGERVEGYTNFLWTAILSGLHAIGLSLPLCSVILGCVFAGASLILTFLLARQVAREQGWSEHMGLIASFLLIAYPGWAYWAFSGMEGMLLTCLVLGFILLGCQRTVTSRTTWAIGLLGALAAMTRWEIVLLWPIVIVTRAIEHSEPPIRRLGRCTLLIAILLLVFGTYFFWRYRYYGELLPNTFYAKVGGSWIRRVPLGLRYLGELGVSWMLPFSGIAWLMGGFRRWTIVLTATLVVLSCYVTWTGSDFFPWLRFYLPALPICAILAAAFIERVSARIAPQSRRTRVRVAATIAMLVTISGLGYLLDYRAARAHLQWMDGWRKVGVWANQALPPDARLAIAPIGNIGFYCEQPILDLLGLTDYEIAHFGETDDAEPPGHQRCGVQSVLRRKPEFMLGQAPVFDHPPSEAEVLNHTLRKTILRLVDTPEFREPLSI